MNKTVLWMNQLSQWVTSSMPIMNRIVANNEVVYLVAIIFCLKLKL